MYAIFYIFKQVWIFCGLLSSEIRFFSILGRSVVMVWLPGFYDVVMV